MSIKSSQDLLRIKSEISEFANSVLTQEWIKNGSSSRISIAELQLNLKDSKNIKKLVFGTENLPGFDGITPIGEGARRHLCYRAKQVLLSILSKNEILRKKKTSDNRQFRRHLGSIRVARREVSKDEIPRLLNKSVESSRLRPNYGISTQNRFSSLRDDDMGNY